MTPLLEWHKWPGAVAALLTIAAATTTWHLAHGDENELDR